MQQGKYESIWLDVWNRVKTYDNIDASQIDAFFSRLQPQAFTEGFLMLTADTNFIKTWIESHYTDVIKKALQEIYNVPFNIAIEVDPSTVGVQNNAETNQVETPYTEKAAFATHQQTQPAPISQSLDTPQQEQQIILDKDDNTSQGEENSSSDNFSSNYSFDNFVTGSSNQMAYSMALAVAESPGKTQLNPLFIYGKSGLGKTHLLRSIQNYVNKSYKQFNTVYVDTMEMVNDYTDATRINSKDSYTQFRRRYENADVLLVDDVQGLQNKPATLNIVFQIFNKMLDSGKQVVLAADRAPKHIDIEERYKSRFNQGGTCDIQPPEIETKLGIIRNFVTECKESTHSDFNLSPEVQEYIAQNSSSNIRELKSAVTKVFFEMKSTDKKDISINEVASLLADHFSGGAMKRLKIIDIQRVVEKYYNVSHSELIGKKRSANITYARQVAIYLCRTMIDIPFSSIGDAFNRDHSTVMYSVKSVDEKIKESRELNEELEIIRQIIREE